ncbi:ubiquitin activating enzyme [Trypanosoma brucei equiperdum]|uniref:Ubiquitin activating enzyme n=1 Tax=Trypanosoma brucei equiperdum TaxID=630700 RepID=A0A3L6KSW3_9TRYP|nr:ubiquitin activating enzyme [Trypanosoma brucei equiperdum]
MNADEKTRYDRQMRLWGKSTQERLRRTEVNIKGITSANAEVAKNLVLAGVGSVVLDDTAPVEAADLKHSFILQGCKLGERRGEASAGKLQSLNPYVAVSSSREIRNRDGAPQSNSSLRVVLARAKCEADMLECAGDPLSGSADVMLLTVDLGHLTAGFFLYRKQKIPFVAQLRALLDEEVGTRPVVFQRVLLLLKMAECPQELNYFERLLFAKGFVRQRSLLQLTREDIEFAAAATGELMHSTAIETTVAGGVFAQLIIHTIGMGSEEMGEGEYAWAISDTSDGVEVQVGHLRNP